MKIVLTAILTTLATLNLLGQQVTQSAISSEKYLLNPVRYLSHLNPNKITTGLLIDKSYYGYEVFQYDGISQVKTATKEEWLSNYYTMKYALIDTSYLPSVDILERVNQLYKSNYVYPIFTVDLDFNRIKEEALNNQDFIEQGDYLVDNHSSVNSYSSHHFVSSSVLYDYIYGDDINFIIPRGFQLSNRDDYELYEIKVDFGNGSGFQTVQMDEIINISYNTESDNVLVRLMIISQNQLDNSFETSYTHFTFFRKGSDLVPLASPGQTLKSGVQTPNITGYYPEGTEQTITICHPCGRYGQCCDDYTIIVGRKICYYILFNPSNTSGKLKRPFVICDGFDPGNTKDYYSSSSDIDPRGMYEILDGQPSPNETNPARPSAELVSKLQTRGYDLVFANFLNGAGDIPDNAEALRGFLNNVINSEYRNENTEELVLVGPSMGGLITRYALSKMEEQNEEHFVKQWISFDSPQKGANVAIGFQWLINYFSKIHTGWIGQLEDAKEQFAKIISMIDLPAARQMVLQHYSQFGEEEDITDYGWFEYGDHMTVGPHPDFNTFYSEIEALNGGKGYPGLPKRYSISNGGKGKRYDEDGAE
jgi:hypothetical protein